MQPSMETDGDGTFEDPNSMSRLVGFVYFGKLFHCKYGGKVMEVRIIREVPKGTSFF